MSVAVQVVPLDALSLPAHADAIDRLEREVYVPGSRESRETIERIATAARGASVVALVDGDLAGLCLGGPLENFASVGGVADDPHLGTGDTLYAADCLVAPGRRGLGLARAMKTRQILLARGLGYARVTGRNRVGLADAMWALNVSLGAREVRRIPGAYPDGPPPHEARYYEIGL